MVKVGRTGTLMWNGTRIRKETLLKYLHIVARLQPQPWVSLDFDAGTNCTQLTNVRTMMTQILHCRETRACLQGQYPYKHST